MQRYWLCFWHIYPLNGKRYCPRWDTATPSGYLSHPESTVEAFTAIFQGLVGVASRAVCQGKPILGAALATRPVLETE